MHEMNIVECNKLHLTCQIQGETKNMKKWNQDVVFIGLNGLYFQNIINVLCV